MKYEDRKKPAEEQFRQLAFDRALSNDRYLAEGLCAFGKDVVRECIVTLQRAIVRNGSGTPENQRTMEHIEDLKARFGLGECFDYTTPG